MSKNWMQRLKAVEVRDATYQPENHPLVYDRAKGTRVWSVDGREYLDFCAGFGSLALGHNHESLLEVLSHYVNSERPPVVQGLGDVYPSRAKIELLETLLAMLPRHFALAALAMTGSQAVEIALKTAMLKTGRHNFICFEGAYHGVDFGALRVTANPFFHQGFEPWSEAASANREFATRLAYGCDPHLLEKQFTLRLGTGNEIAAILVEPIQGRAGMIQPPAGWLQSLRAISQKYGALLIFDEIFCGLGRAGKISFSEDVACDMTCLGKAMGGGMALSACVGTREAMTAWPESTGEARHTGTFFGHPLSATVAKATLKTIGEMKLEKASLEKGAYFKQQLESRLKSRVDGINVRGKGLMLALDFGKAGMGAMMMDRLRAEGMIALASGESGQSLSLTPPLIVSQQEIDVAINLIEACLP